MQDSRSAARPRRIHGDIRTRAGQPQLLESVELTPGGRKKHTLQRTSPGGTTRASQYISPSRAEVIAELRRGGENPEDWEDWMTIEDVLDMEQWRRRNVAMEFVPGQQTEFQQELVRSAKRARAIEYPCA